MKDHPRGIDSGASPGGKARRPYRTPVVADYGPIARLTAGGSGVSMEFVFMFAMTKRP